MGNSAKFVNLLGNLFERVRFVEENWEVWVFGVGDLGGVLVFVFEDDGDDLCKNSQVKKSGIEFDLPLMYSMLK